MGYLTIGKSAIGIIERNLSKTKVFAKAENPLGEVLQMAKEAAEVLPKDLRKKAGLVIFDNLMTSQMAKTFCKISLDKKQALIKCLSGKYGEKELVEIINAESPDKLAESLKLFMDTASADLPKVYTQWLGFPTFTQKLTQQGFPAIRKHILSNMRGKCSQQDYLSLVNAKNENELFDIFNKVTSKIQRQKIQKGVPIEVEQAMYDFTRKRNDTFLDIYKAIKTEPINPKVSEIENTLRTKYGMKFVDLGDNEERANQILQAVELNVSKGRKIPDNLVVTKLLNDCGEALFHSNSETTVLLEHKSSMDIFQSFMQFTAENTKNKQLQDCFNKVTNGVIEIAKTRLSTEHPLHTVVHEFNHLGQNQLLAARFRRIPNEFESTYKGLSDYAAEGIVGEIEAELLTKQQLAKLTADEGRLLDYLN